MPPVVSGVGYDVPFVAHGLYDCLWFGGLRFGGFRTVLWLGSVALVFVL